jgi:hypothetical protein
MKYNVAVEIHGLASVIVEAENIEEAKKKAFAEDQFGANGYWWWYVNQDRCAVSTTEMMHPDGVMSVDDLNGDWVKPTE